MKMAQWTPSAEGVTLPGTRLPAYVVLPYLVCLVYVPFLPYALVSTLVVWWMTKKGYDSYWVLRRIMGKLHGNRISSRPIWVIRRFAYLNDPAASAPRLPSPYQTKTNARGK